MDQAVHCSTATAGANATVFEAKGKLAGQFRRRGMAVATMSGVAYGVLYGLMTLDAAMGVWAVWYGGKFRLPILPKCFAGRVGAAYRYLQCHLGVALIAGFKGKLGDLPASPHATPARRGAYWRRRHQGPWPAPACWGCRAPVPSSCPSARCVRPSGPF